MIKKLILSNAYCLVFGLLTSFTSFSQSYALKRDTTLILQEKCRKCKPFELRGLDTNYKQQYLGEDRQSIFTIDTLWGLKELTPVTFIHKKSERQLIHEIDSRYATGMFAENQTGSEMGFDFIRHREYTIWGTAWDFIQRSGYGAMGTSALHGAIGSPAYYLDEMPTDSQTLQCISLMDVAYIKYIGPPFMGAYLGGAGGAICVYTKKGDDLLGYSTEDKRLKMDIRAAIIFKILWESIRYQVIN